MDIVKPFVRALKGFRLWSAVVEPGLRPKIGNCCNNTGEVSNTGERTFIRSPCH